MFVPDSSKGLDTDPLRRPMKHISFYFLFVIGAHIVRTRIHQSLVMIVRNLKRIKSVLIIFCLVWWLDIQWWWCGGGVRVEATETSSNASIFSETTLHSVGMMNTFCIKVLHKLPKMALSNLPGRSWEFQRSMWYYTLDLVRPIFALYKFCIIIFLLILWLYVFIGEGERGKKNMWLGLPSSSPHPIVKQM